MQATRRLGSISLLMTVTLVLVACSGKGTTQSASDLLSQIKTQKHVNVFLDATFQPYEYYDKSNHLTGFDVDFATQMFKDLGVAPRFTDIKFAGLLTALAEGKANVVISAIGYTPERARSFGMSVPYFAVSHDVYVPASSAITTLEDLSSKTVGAQIATTHEAAIRAFSQTLPAAGKPGIKSVRTYDSVPLEIADLGAHRIDAVVDNRLTIEKLGQARHIALRFVGSVGKPLYIVVVTRKADSSLLNFVNTQILKMRQDGTLASLQQRWFGYNNVDSLPTALPSG